MESSYLTVDFFRKLPQEVEKTGNPTASAMDRYTEAHLRRIGMPGRIPKHYLHILFRTDNAIFCDTHIYVNF